MNIWNVKLTLHKIFRILRPAVKGLFPGTRIIATDDVKHLQRIKYELAGFGFGWENHHLIFILIFYIRIARFTWQHHFVYWMIYTFAKSFPLLFETQHLPSWTHRSVDLFWGNCCVLYQNLFSLLLFLVFYVYLSKIFMFSLLCICILNDIFCCKNFSICCWIINFYPSHF